MSLRSRLKQIEGKMPKPEIKIIVRKEGDSDIPDDWNPDIIVGASPEWLERQKKLKDSEQ